MILRCGNEVPSAKSIEEAAAFAVKNSQGREGENIPVDFTKVRFVKKPSGSLPGKVIYTDYQTVIIHHWKDILTASD